MTDLLNQKVKSSFNKEQDRAIVAGMYGFNATSGKWNYANVDDNGDLKVNIHATGGGGDLKARSDIADPASSTFVKCNTDGTLEMTAELSSAGLATSAIQTDGTQKAKMMGGETDGTQQQLLVSNLGVLQVLDSEVFGKTSQIANQTTLSNTNEATLIANQTNGTQQVKCMGVNGGTPVQLALEANGSLVIGGGAVKTAVDSAGATQHILVDADGHLQVDIQSITGNTPQIKAEDDTGAARNVRCNNSGHIKSACIGVESDGTLRQIQTNDAGQLKTKLIADDGATRREVRCDANGKLSVVDGETTQTVHTLFSGTQVIAASPASFSFDSAGANTDGVLDVDGLTKATYIITGSGTSTSLEVSEMIGDTNSTLASNISSSKFMTGLQNFSYSSESVGQYRGLRVANLSSNSYTITSIKIVYNK